MGFPAVEVTGSGVLGIELLSSTRTASALYHGAISLAPFFVFYFFIFIETEFLMVKVALKSWSFSLYLSKCRDYSQAWLA